MQFRGKLICKCDLFDHFFPAEPEASHHTVYAIDEIGFMYAIRAAHCVHRRAMAKKETHMRSTFTRITVDLSCVYS